MLEPVLDGVSAENRHCYAYLCSPPLQMWSRDGRQAFFLAEDGTLHHLDAESIAVSELPIVLDDLNQESFWYWMDDGRVVIAGVPDRDTGTRQIITYDFAADTSTAITTPAWGFNDLPRFSGDERYIAWITGNPNIYDTQTGAIRELRPQSPSYGTSPGGEVFWHDQQNWFLLREDALFAGGGAYRWTGVASGDGTIHRELGYCADPTPVCINWLPSHVDRASLSPGQSLALPAPEIVIRVSDWTWSLSWSPDGHRLATAPGPERGFDNGTYPFTVWDIATGETVGSVNISYDRITWVKGPDDGYFPTEDLKAETANQGEDAPIISPDGLFAVEFHWSERRVCIVRAGGEVLVELPFAGQAAAFSPDSARLAVSTSWDIYIYSVADLGALVPPKNHVHS